MLDIAYIVIISVISLILIINLYKKHKYKKEFEYKIREQSPNTVKIRIKGNNAVILSIPEVNSFRNPPEKMALNIVTNIEGNLVYNNFLYWVSGTGGINANYRFWEACRAYL